MVRIVPIGLAPFVLVVACPRSPRATTKEWGTIAGTVRDITTSEPVAFTDVTVLSTGMGTFTKQDGRFVILRIHEVNQTQGAPMPIQPPVAMPRSWSSSPVRGPVRNTYVSAIDDSV